jgi:hypothetical protein
LEQRNLLPDTGLNAMVEFLAKRLLIWLQTFNGAVFPVTRYIINQVILQDQPQTDKVRV